MSGKVQKHMPDGDRLHELLRFDAQSGKLFWRARELDSFAQGREFGRYWNERWADTEALACPSGLNGYLHGKIYGRMYSAHRVIWKMHHGNEPQEINWLDGNVTNNRLENLVENFHEVPSLATLARQVRARVGRRRALRSDAGKPKRAPAPSGLESSSEHPAKHEQT